MRAITNRIRKLEARLAPTPNMEAYRMLSILHERCRQRLEQEGVPVEELPPPLPPPTVGVGNPLVLQLSIAETLRRCQEIRAERQAEQTEALGQAEVATDNRS
jgi:hypothetical protein